MTEYTPLSHQLISHEEAIGLRLEELVERRHAVDWWDQALRSIDLEEALLEMLLYPPAQFTSHEEALALEFEQLVEDAHQRRKNRVAAQRQFMNRAQELLDAKPVPEPVLMTPQQWEDILLYEKSLSRIARPAHVPARAERRRLAREATRSASKPRDYRKYKHKKHHS